MGNGALPPDLNGVAEERRRRRWVWFALSCAAAALAWLAFTPARPGLPSDFGSGSYSRASSVGQTGQPTGPLIESYSPSLGPAEARLEVVQYVDFSCPYSQQAYVPLREFVALHPAEVKLVVRQFPIDELHPRARPAAVAAVCAQRQGKFWPYYDRLFASQGSHEEADLVRYATQVGLDLTAWQSCRSGADAAAEVQRDYEDGVARGVPGTPTFFINGYRLSGALPLEAWEQVLERLGR